MSNHDRILAAVFDEPTRANLAWRSIEALFISLGARIEEGSGSRVRVLFGHNAATFHRPHPGKEASKPTVRAVREYLRRAGFAPMNDGE